MPVHCTGCDKDPVRNDGGRVKTLSSPLMSSSTVRTGPTTVRTVRIGEECLCLSTAQDVTRIQ